MKTWRKKNGNTPIPLRLQRVDPEADGEAGMPKC